jgi:amino acid adenylation domain-containing protein
MTQSNLTVDKTLVEMFEASAAKFPDAPAVHFNAQTLTYGQLNSKANQLARILRARGVSKDRVVALVLDRSIEMMIAILAILKAGGAYLPIVPKSPNARVAFLLEDSNALLLLTQSRFLSRGFCRGSIDLIDMEDESIYQGDDSCLDVEIDPHDLVYVIYTSGTSGKPKGVMIEHHSLANRLVWMQSRYPLGPDDIILQKTCYSFDVSVWELLWWSIPGAQVCFLEQGHEVFPQAIIDVTERKKITTMHFVPSMFGAFLDYVGRSQEANRLSTIRRIFTSGEELTPHHVSAFNDLLFKENGTRLTNLYGPTEATIDVTYYDCPTNGRIDSVPIGRAIDNTALYVLRDERRQGVDQEGELYISGKNVARGYLNRASLTEEKFVLDPFDPGNRMYRTGDLAKFREDGEIIYLGRIDNQVKISGRRIELGEIESLICEFGGIEKCAVVAKRTSETVANLIAFIVASEKFEPDALEAHLREQLLDFMVPSQMIDLRELPMLSSGKIDRKQLLEKLE